MKQFNFEKQSNFSKPISSTIMKKLGSSFEGIIPVSSLDELRKHKFNIVIAECISNVSFTQNHFKDQILKKKTKYVMGLSLFQQLWYDKNRNKKILIPAGPKFNNLYRPYNGQNLDNKSLLVSRTGGIGDLIFILPNLKYLKEKYPTCKIIFATGPQYHDMIKHWDCVNEVLDLPYELSHFLQADYHAYFEGVIERCIEAHSQNAYNLFTRWLGLNLPNELLIPKQNPQNNKVEYCKKFIKDHNIDQDKIILFQLTASSIIRTPRPSIWKDIMLKLIDKGYQIIITDNPLKSPNIEFFRQTVQSDQIFNFSTFSKSIDYSIAMTSLAKCTVSSDTSLMHIAASLDIPAFGLYGPFQAEIRLSTYKNVDWINSKTSCAPCWTHGQNPCKNSTNGHSKCYDSIDIDECVEKIERLINA